MIGRKKKEQLQSPPEGAAGQEMSFEQQIEEGMKSAKPIYSVPDAPAPSAKENLKRVGLLLGVIILLSGFGSLVYFVAFNKTEAPVQAPKPEPKPTLSSIKLKGDEELKNLKYEQDYSVEFANGNYLIEVVKTPKRLIYNGKEVYRGEDLVTSSLSPDGKKWAYQISRKEERTKRDENTKLLQTTTVDVATYFVDGQKWGERDNAKLLSLSNAGAPAFLQDTGRQTPSQYGEPLNEQVIYNGEEKRFTTSYGVVSYVPSGDNSSWLVTTKNPSTKDVYDFYVDGSKKDSLDARILKRLSVDDEGNYLVAFCQQPSEITVGVGLIGKDCQISVNGKTRTTISGTVYLASVLGDKETYAGIDRELRQSFSKNARLDFIVEHRKDMDEDNATELGVYLNEGGDKYAVTSSRMVTVTKNDGTQETVYRMYLSINSELVENEVNAPSLLGFGTGEDSATLFIYELPKPDPVAPSLEVRGSAESEN
jgi:hypothetical protein